MYGLLGFGGAEGDRPPDLLTASFRLSVAFIEFNGLTVGKSRQNNAPSATNNFTNDTFKPHLTYSQTAIFFTLENPESGGLNINQITIFRYIRLGIFTINITFSRRIILQSAVYITCNHPQ